MGGRVWFGLIAICIKPCTICYLLVLVLGLLPTAIRLGVQGLNLVKTWVSGYVGCPCTGVWGYGLEIIESFLLLLNECQRGWNWVL